MCFNTQVHKIEGRTIYRWLYENTLTINKPAFSCNVGYRDAQIAGGNICPFHFTSAYLCLLSLEALLPSISSSLSGYFLKKNISTGEISYLGVKITHMKLQSSSFDKKEDAFRTSSHLLLYLCTREVRRSNYRAYLEGWGLLHQLSMHRNHGTGLATDQNQQ